MPQNIYTDNASTTLTSAGGISATQTTFTVLSSSGFPTPGANQQFIALFTDVTEWVAVTNVTGNTWTVTRGIDPLYPGVSHSNGATIIHVAAANDFNGFAQLAAGTAQTFQGLQVAPGANGDILDAVSSQGSVLTKLDSRGNLLGLAIAPPTGTLTIANGGAGNVDAGAHDWAISFVGPWGVAGSYAETALGPHTTFTNTLNNVNISNVPLGPSGTTARNVYRSLKGTTGPMYYVGQINDNSTTTYIDTSTDYTIASNSHQWTMSPAISSVHGVLLDEGGANINVKALRYGAKGDGVTDDTNAVLAAINDLPGTGGKLFFPAGFYNLASLTGPLTFKKSVTIEGVGTDQFASSGTVLKFPAGISGLRFVVGCDKPRVTSIGLLGAGPTSGAADGIQLWNGNQAILEHITVYQFGRDGFSLDSTSRGVSGNMNNALLRSCRAELNGRHGFYIIGANSQNITFQLCDASDNYSWGYANGAVPTTVMASPAPTYSGGIATFNVAPGFGQYYQTNWAISLGTGGIGGTVTNVTGDQLQVSGLAGAPAAWTEVYQSVNAAANTFYSCHASSNGKEQSIQSGSTTTVINVPAGSGTQFNVGSHVYISNVGSNSARAIVTANSANTVTVTTLAGAPPAGALLIQYGGYMENSAGTMYISPYNESDRGTAWIAYTANATYWLTTSYKASYMYPGGGGPSMIIGEQGTGFVQNFFSLGDTTGTMPLGTINNLSISVNGNWWYILGGTVPGNGITAWVTPGGNWQFQKGAVVTNDQGGDLLDINPRNIGSQIQIDPFANYVAIPATPPGAPTVANGAAGNVDAGAHDWAVSFTGPWGKGGVAVETSPGTHVTFTNTLNQVSLTNVPLGPTNTIQRNIYRSLKGTTGPMYNVGSIGDNTTTTFTDNTSDANLALTTQSWTRYPAMPNVHGALFDQGGAGINVKASKYGARGDGNTNDTAAFQAVINDLPTQGGKIIIPPGRYKINSTLNINCPIVIQGSGSGRNAPNYGTYLDFSGADVTGISLGLNSNNSHISDLFLQGAGTSLGTSDGIRFGSNMGILENVSCFGFSRDGFNMDSQTYGTSCNNSKLINCTALGNWRHGFYLNGGNSQVVTLIGCDATSNHQWGFSNGAITGAAQNRFLQCHAAGNGVTSTVQSGSTQTTINVTNGSSYISGGTIAVAVAGGYVATTINSITGNALSVTSLGSNPIIGGIVLQFGAFYDNTNSSSYDIPYIEQDGYGGVLFDVSNSYVKWIGSNYADIQVFYPMASGTTRDTSYILSGKHYINSRMYIGDRANYNSTGGWEINGDNNNLNLKNDAYGINALQLNQNGQPVFPIINPPTGTLTIANGAAGAVDAGAHDWAISFVGTWGQFGHSAETSPGTHTTFTNTLNQVSLSAIPLGPTGTTARNIYRSMKGTTAPLYYVGQIPDNVTTTYSDYTTDASLGNTLNSWATSPAIANINAALYDTGGAAINPKAAKYGARGDGNTNDTAAFQAAINDLPTQGGKITIPPGRYKLNTLTITVPVIIEGAGSGQNPPRYGTYLDFSGSDQPGIILTATAEKSVLKNFYATGPGTTGITTLGTSDGLSVKCTEAFFEHVSFNGFSRDGISLDTTSSGNATDCKFINVQANTNARHGFYFAGGNSQNETLIGCDADSNGRWGFRNGPDPAAGNGAATNCFFHCHAAANGVSSTVQTGSTQTAIIVAAGMGSKFASGQQIVVATTTNGYVTTTINSITTDTLNVTSLGYAPSIGGFVLEGGAFYDNSSSSRYYHNYMESDGHGGVQFDTQSVYPYWISGYYDNVQIMYPLTGNPAGSGWIQRANTLYSPFYLGDWHGDNNNVPGSAQWLMSSGQYGPGWFDLRNNTNGKRTFIVDPTNGTLQPMQGLASANQNAGGDIFQALNAPQGGVIANIDSVGNIKTTRGFAQGLATKTASYTLASTDSFIIVNAASLTMTLPSAASAGVGRMYTIKNGASATNTVVTSTSGTVDGVTNYSALTTAYMSSQFISDGTNWFVF